MMALVLSILKERCIELMNCLEQKEQQIKEYQFEKSMLLEKIEKTKSAIRVMESDSDEKQNPVPTKENESRVYLSSHLRVKEYSISELSTIVNHIELMKQEVQQDQEHDRDLFHLALSTRNEIIIRSFLEYIPISWITSEQLEFFIPLDSSEREQSISISMCKLLVEYQYEFKKDEVTTSFMAQMPNVI